MINETDKQVIEKYETQLKTMDVPDKKIIRELTNIAMNRHVEDADFWSMGKYMQYELNLAIDYRCQDEVVAGYWQWLRLQMNDTTSLFDNFESLLPQKN